MSMEPKKSSERFDGKLVAGILVGVLALCAVIIIFGRGHRKAAVADVCMALSDAAAAAENRLIACAQSCAAGHAPSCVRYGDEVTADPRAPAAMLARAKRAYDFACNAQIRDACTKALLLSDAGPLP